ncbi:MAG TPA: hypothetical protein VEL07_08685 [Planctomycetota bacterium]|nr:hypothetical protein [Planctomycetota bacterium]
MQAETATATPTPAGSAAKGAVLRWLDRIGERANPILVRIVRQELRSRAFIGVFAVLLVAALIASIVVGTFSDQADEGMAARGLFGVLAWAWWFALVVVQPTVTFLTVANERNEDTWDLVELTGMRPRRVLAGLLTASVVQSILYTSALAPFMLLSYLLRGLDLGTIVIVLLLVPLHGIAASTLAAFCACLGNNKATRALLAVILIIGLVMLWLGTASMFFSLHTLHRIGIEVDVRRWTAEVWAAVGAYLNGWAAFVATMLVLSSALLTFRAADRSGGPRLLWYALWANALAWVLIADRIDAGDELGEFLAVFGFGGMLWAMCLGLFSLSEDFELSPRQARAITAPNRWLRPFTWLLGPGAARGRWAYLVLASLSLAICGAGWLIEESTARAIERYRIAEEAAIKGWALYCYAAIVFVICDRLYRGPLRALFPTPPLRRGMTILAMAVIALVPLLALVLIDSSLVDSSAFAALSPIGGMVLFDRDLGSSSGTYLLLSVVGICATGVLLLEASRLGIRTQRIVARDNERNPRAG